MTTTNSMAKIRLKVGPKQYKRGPGPTGRSRLQRQVNSLLQAASRFSRKDLESYDALWAQHLVVALQDFNEQHGRPDKVNE